MDLRIDITCPGCKFKFKQPLSNMKPHNTCTCPKCNKTIQFTGDNLSQVERDVNRSVNNIKKSFKGLG